MSYDSKHTSIPAVLLRAITAVLACVCMHGCFTGIESTPTISRRDVDRRGASDVALPGDTVSETYGEAPRLWAAGKKFYVTDSRIGALFKVDASTAPQSGDTLTFVGFSPATSVLGTDVTDIVLDAGAHDAARRLTYRVNMSHGQLMARHRIAIPYTVELSEVDNARKNLSGLTMYIKSPVWCDAGGTPVADGLHLVPVEIVDVQPGTESNPLRVIFAYTDNGERQIRSIYTRSGDKALDKIFTPDNPRAGYPDITDEVWAMITRGRVRAGMTRAECRLALGAPDDIERGYGYSSVHERWSYASGLYLLFTDDILTSTNR